jgi:hypothetical protein
MCIRNYRVAFSNNFLSLKEESGLCTTEFWKALKPTLPHCKLIMNYDEKDIVSEDDVANQQKLVFNWNWNGVIRIRWGTYSTNIMNPRPYCCFTKHHLYHVDWNILTLSSNSSALIRLQYGIKLTMVDKIINQAFHY